jgi:hypothetical protein
MGCRGLVAGRRPPSMSHARSLAQPRSPFATFLAFFVVCICCLWAASEWREDLDASVVLEAEGAVGKGAWGTALADYERSRNGIIHHTESFASCVAKASGVPEGTACLGVFLSLLPSTIAHKAAIKTATPDHDYDPNAAPGELAEALAGCMHVSQSFTAAAFCLESFLSNIPTTVVQEAVKMARKYPSFDWERGSHEVVGVTQDLYYCVREARSEASGNTCLSSYLHALPPAMATRAVRVAAQIPAPFTKAEAPQKLSATLLGCLRKAEHQDAAVYCLTSFLNHLPEKQVQVAWGVPEATFVDSEANGDDMRSGTVGDAPGDSLTAQGARGREQQRGVSKLRALAAAKRRARRSP